MRGRSIRALAALALASALALPAWAGWRVVKTQNQWSLKGAVVANSDRVANGEWVLLLVASEGDTYDILCDPEIAARCLGVRVGDRVALRGFLDADESADRRIQLIATKFKEND